MLVVSNLQKFLSGPRGLLLPQPVDLFVLFGIITLSL